MKTNTVDITVGGTTYNSLTNFGLAIKNTDYIGTPVRDEHITFVPGRDGPVDYTDEVFGGPSFNYRTIEIEFGGVQEPEDWDTWISTFRNLFEGKTIKLEFATDPGWYYSGRASIEDFEHNRAMGVFALVIERAYPYKQKDVSLTTTATAAGATVSAVVTRQTVIPTVTSVSTITITTGGNTYSFDAGTHKDLEFKLAAGTHSLVVKGSGAVTIAYKDGSL